MLVSHIVHKLPWLVEGGKERKGELEAGGRRRINRDGWRLDLGR